MFIWELRRVNTCNHYMIHRESNIRTGLVFRGHRVFIYTPILNNDISSYIKVILNKSSSLKASGQTNSKKKLIDYVRRSSNKSPIPSILQIEEHLCRNLNINEQTSIHDHGTFMSLLYRIYLIIYLLHCNMPIQRKCLPGNRNAATSIQDNNKRGWFASLSPQY